MIYLLITRSWRAVKMPKRFMIKANEMNHKQFIMLFSMASAQLILDFWTRTQLLLDTLTSCVSSSTLLALCWRRRAHYDCGMKEKPPLSKGDTSHVKSGDRSYQRKAKVTKSSHTPTLGQRIIMGGSFIYCFYHAHAHAH